VLHCVIAHADDAKAPSLAIDSYAGMSAYTDSDHVTVLSPGIGVTARDPNVGWNLGARYLVDAVSAASVDIVATASRRWSEVRHQLSGSAGYEQADTSLGASASTSIEPDYFAATGGVQGGLKLDRDMVTLAFRYAVGHDRAGRTGTPFRTFERVLWKHGPALGASFVLDAASLLFVGVDANFEQGDQAKPYRYVPTFDAATAAALPAGAPIEQVNRVRRPETPSERLPLARGRYALTLRYIRGVGPATLRAEERLYIDSWGLFASSSDLRCALELSRRLEVAPSLRLHAQTGAAFWRRAYVVQADQQHGELPSIRTGDRELGPLWTVTLGGDLRYALNAGYASSPAIKLRVAGMRTAYLNSLFIEHRFALFTSLMVEGTFE
jgi:hypothetical protein